MNRDLYMKFIWKIFYFKLISLKKCLKLDYITIATTTNKKKIDCVHKRENIAVCSVISNLRWKLTYDLFNMFCYYNDKEKY